MWPQRIAEVQWFVRCAASAILLLCVAGLAAARIGSGVQLPSTTTRDGTLVTLNTRTGCMRRQRGNKLF
jgi:hypothetical protein